MSDQSTNNVSGCLSPNQHKIHNTTESSTGSNANGQTEKEERGRGHQQRALHWQSQVSLRPHNPYCTDKARSHSDHTTPTALTKPGLTQTTQPLLHWQSQISLRPQPLLHWQSQVSLRPRNPYCTDKARSHSDHNPYCTDKARSHSDHAPHSTNYPFKQSQPQITTKCTEMTVSRQEHYSPAWTCACLKKSCNLQSLFSDLVFSTAFVQRQCGWGMVVVGVVVGVVEFCLPLASLWAMPTPISGLSMGNANTYLWPLYGQCSTNLSLASLWAMPTPISGLSMGNANTYLLPLYGQCQYLSLASMGNANTYLSSLYGQCQHLSLVSLWAMPTPISCLKTSKQTQHTRYKPWHLTVFYTSSHSA